MKKIIMLSSIILTACGQGCSSRKQVSKIKTRVDSARVVSSNEKVKLTGKDSTWNAVENNFAGSSGNMDLWIDRISKTVVAAPEAGLLFRLKTGVADNDGDTLTVADINTGAVAKAYKDPATGEMLVRVSEKSGIITKYEINGIRFSSSRHNAGGSIVSKGGSMKFITKDSSREGKDSTVLKTHSEAVQKTIKKDFGLLKLAGLIAILAAMIRLVIYLLRNQWPPMGWLNKILGGK